ncbi:MAG: hypothetical protein HON14_07000 [Rhodospirillaceae bacterium]|jgi:hypothetical protein|nr:hypothetical protein [Rhodospirillaceae bacterium]MBT4589798.1 hypothetical protein [Rhodospirillaceae bacterium]MBT4938863.1 hypothetical protein [Rhodospirillaceae bacterium]MBT5938413.1 hypothetical protein [Rhodospirillaceae bacterium]MBT7268191.1 hypothetical protein [Rhodospirillaceae bacterium]
MATYLYNLVDSAWTGYSNLFDALPYGDPYISVATLFAVVAMASKTVSSGWK